MPYQQPLKEFVHLAVNPTHAHFTHPAKTDAEYYLHLRVEVPSGNLPDYYPLQIINQTQFRRPHQEVENKEICSKHRMFELLPPTLAVKPTASVLKLIPHMPRSCSTTIMQHRYHVMPCPTSAIWFCIVGAFDKASIDYRCSDDALKNYLILPKNALPHPSTDNAYTDFC